ncbi:VirB4 family type IV secretion system protein [Anaerofustis stercorihominis]|uniref:VirB4 family type IV secretion system protein n=1 Tax=Anaerofustis stercorihominis TaxID=214853 RepID=UPI0039845A71
MRKKKKDNIKEEKRVDEALFSYIQPQGGITFKEPNYIIAGDGYIRCIHIYQLPKILEDFWLDNIFDIEDAIITMDIDTKDTVEVKKNINRSIQEENARLRTAKNFSEVYDADTRRQELQAMYDELSSMGEVMKSVDLRIFVKGRNLIELDERCENIIKKLESDSFMATTFLNEGKREWQSLLESAPVQQKKAFAMPPHPLLTEQIAFGNPYCYSELIDEFGDLIGFTPVGGTVIFDEFHKSASRKHYNSLVVGDMGSGKSTYLKKRFKANAAKGNYIRTFDVTGEFENLTKEFGGKIIKCNGTDGMLNPLEILKAGDDDFTSYARHISKVTSFYRCLVPSVTDQMLINLEVYLREFYEQYDLVPKDGRNITGLPAKSYPTFSDFLIFLSKRIEEFRNLNVTGNVDVEITKNEAIKVSELAEAIRSLVLNYGRMFDGHTSVDNITDEKIVTFDISDIKDLGNPFNAQMFNMVSLCWDNAVKNGEIMKNLWESKKIDIRDVNCFLILIDESHRWVNTKMPQILNLLISYAREARKYFAGITFASQSIRDYMPQGEGDPNIDLIRTLFELTQYKFMFRQDSSTLPLLNSIFNNALSFSQIEQIPYLNIGESILSIAGDISIKFKVWLSQDYEAKLFAGGR